MPCGTCSPGRTFRTFPHGGRGRPKTGSRCVRRGAARQTEKLRNMIDASQHDLDYWTALNDIAIRIQEERRWWPAILADWDIAVRRGTWSRPARAPGNQGQPHYAKDARNLWIAYAFRVLVHLGLGKMEGYYVIADELDKSENAVIDAIQSARARGPTPGAVGVLAAEGAPIIHYQPIRRIGW